MLFLRGFILKGTEKAWILLKNGTRDFQNSPPFWEIGMFLCDNQRQFFMWQSETISDNWWKMLFISPWKLFSFLRNLRFCLDFLVIYKNGLIRKIRLIFKIMTSQPGQQTIAIHIFPNISRSKDNQTMKFGQLIEKSIPIKSV